MILKFSQTMRFLSARLAACQSNHRKRPTVQNADPIASILSQSKGYFCLHEPFLFQK